METDQAAISLSFCRVVTQCLGEIQDPLRVGVLSHYHTMFSNADLPNALMSVKHFINISLSKSS